MAVTTAAKKPSRKAKGRAKARERSHIDVYLIVRAPEIDPQEITRKLRLNPTTTWRRGDFIHPPATHRYKDDGWELKAKYSRGTELTKYVEALIDQVNGSADRFLNLPADASVYVQCDICDYEFRRTDLSLSKEAIQGIASLGAELDIDYYDLSDSDSVK